MAYIGNKPTVGNFQICDAISVVNGQAAYTMQVGSVNVIPQSANHMIVSLNGTIQKPNSSFTVSGSTITFSSNLATGDVIDFIQILGDVLDLGVPSDATVTAAKLGANSVTSAKLNNDIISGTTELASEPADTDEFLVSDAGTLKRIDYSLIKGGGLTMARLYRLSATTSGTQNLTSNIEEVDTEGYGGLGSNMSLSSGVFTFPSTGIYLIQAQAAFQTESGQSSNYHQLHLQVTTNNSSYTAASIGWGGGVDATEYSGCFTQHILDVTDTANHKVRFRFETNHSTSYILGNSGDTYTGFSFLKLGDT